MNTKQMKDFDDKFSEVIDKNWMNSIKAYINSLEVETAKEIIEMIDDKTKAEGFMTSEMFYLKSLIKSKYGIGEK